MPQLDPVEWGILTTLGFFAAVTLWMIFWPRAHYESRDPFRRGEDFWTPFRRHKGRKFSRGPRLFSPPTPTERGLEEAVAARLRLAPSLEWRDILVRAQGEDIFLQGHVPSVEEKELARILSLSVEGVRAVYNELAVQDAPDWVHRAS